MRRPAIVLLAAGLVVAACSGASGTSASAPSTVDNPVVGVTVASAVARTAPPTVATTAIPIAGTAAATPDTTEAATAAAVQAKLPDPIAPPPEGVTEPQQVVGKIEIPKMGIDENLYEGIALTTLDRGPGHWPGTAMPGQPGNVVVAGHRVSHSKPFLHIDTLAEGDEVKFTVNDAVYTYVVTSHEIVDPTAIRIVAQTPEPTATLFACHPPGSVAERYVVHLALKTN